MYIALILLPDNTNASLEKAKLKLIEYFNHNYFANYNVRIAIKEGKLILTVDEWSMFITVNSEPYVLVEAQEIAELFATENDPNKNALATYSARFELSSAPDPNMDYFNDYVFVIENLCEFTGAVAFDPKARIFI
jgi:hypothetical protein